MEPGFVTADTHLVLARLGIVAIPCGAALLDQRIGMARKQQRESEEKEDSSHG